MRSLTIRAALVLLVCASVLAGPAVAGATPNSLSPGNGGVLAADAQSFSWLDNLSEGAIDHWYLEISTNPLVDYYPWGFFAGDLAYSSGNLASRSVSLNALGRALTPGTYYWHVGGYYGPYGSLGTSWSGVQSFTVRSANPIAPPTIAVNPASFTFSVEQGDTSWHAGDLAISNSGGSVLNFTVPSFSVMWLGAAPGNNTGSVYTLPIAVRAYSDAGATVPLTPGTYTTSISVQDNGSSPAATNSPKLVPVTLHVVASDNVAPTAASVSIAAGRAAINTASVTLIVSASDAGSGMGDMRFAQAPGAWSQWVPYKATRTWILPPGDGIKTVDVQFRDKVGNESALVSDTIVLDTVKPTTQAPSAARVAKGKTATLVYSILDAAPNGGKGVATIRIKTLAGKVVKTLRAGPKAVNTRQTVKFTCTLAKKTYKFFVYAADSAGNAQSLASSNRLTVK